MESGDVSAVLRLLFGKAANITHSQIAVTIRIAETIVTLELDNGGRYKSTVEACKPAIDKALTPVCATFKNNDNAVG